MSEAYDSSDRRAYFRVLTRIPIRCRPVSEPESQGLAQEILERRSPDLSRVDPALAHWLARIERKLDRVLVQLGVGDPVIFSESDVEEVLLSGSGLSVPLREVHDAGTLLQVEFELPGPPEHRVRCLGRVVRMLPAKREGESDLTAVSFDVIHDGDREAIVRHAVEVQRVLLRTRAQRSEEG